MGRNRTDRQASVFTFDFSQPVEVIQEGDQDYYKERLVDYEDMQRQVCGQPVNS